MRASRVGAVASFVLTAQFLLTLLWEVQSWPPSGLAGLAEAMAAYFLSTVHDPLMWTLVNMYNVSFAISALVLGVFLRDHFRDYPRLFDVAFGLVMVAVVLTFASGAVPMIALPGLVKAGDTSAVNALVSISTGLLLGATMAFGFTLSLFAALGFLSKRLPSVLCTMLLIVGVIEIVEFAVPAFLVLDPLLGTCWSLWLGILLWRDQLAHSDSGSRQPVNALGVAP